MDYKDYELGVPKDFFWFKGKRGLIAILLEKLSPGPRAKILNIGAGVGEDISVLSRFGDVYVVDTEPRALALVPEHDVAEKKLCDARSLDYPDGFFDIVVAFDTLEHIEDDSKAMDEITRVLKPGGGFAFTVPAFQFLFSAHDRELGHQRRYSMKTVRLLIRNMDIEATGFWTFFLFFPLAVHRLFDRKRQNTSLDYFRLHGFLNSLFYAFLKVENLLVKAGVPLPIGTTIYGICRKNPSGTAYNNPEG